MDLSLRKLTAVVLTASTLLVTGCSFFSDKKPNTMEPDAILSMAKKEIFENFKASAKESLERYEDEYMQTFIGWPSSGKSKFTFNIDANDNGTVEGSVEVESEMDLSAMEKLDRDSTLRDFMESVSGEGNYVFKVKGDVPPVGEFEATVDFSLMVKDMVYYGKINDATLEKDIPNVLSKKEFDLVVSDYIGTWYKLDLAEFIDSNPMFSQVLEMKIGDLSNVDAEVLSRLIDAYVDEVILKEQWLSADKDSMEDHNKGDKYDVYFREEKIEDFLIASYDFVENNLEDVDKVFDLTGSRNPLLAVSLITLEDLRGELEGGREDFVKQIRSEVSTDMKFMAVFSGDKLVVFGFDYEIPENDEMKGDVMVRVNFEEEKHNFEKANIDVEAKIEGIEDDVQIDLVAGLNKPAGDSRTSKADLTVKATDSESEVMNLKASMEADVNVESQVVNSFDMSMTVDLPEGEIENVEGMDFMIDYNGGDNGSIDASAASRPSENQLFNVSVDGEFSKESGNGKLNFEVTPEEDETVKGMFGVEYDFSFDDVDFELPAEVEDAQDYTGVVLQLLEAAIPATPLYPGVTNPAMLQDELGIQGELNVGADGQIELTDEQIQQLLQSQSIPQ